MIRPHVEEIEEARKNPGGWVYRVAGAFTPTQSIPPEAIVGAWKVDESGHIIEDFIPNPKYDAQRWPASID